MNNWNGLDFFIFLILTINTVLGMARGATRELISLMCLSAALIISIKFTIPLANFFNSSSLINDVVTSKIMQNFMFAINAGPMTSALLNQINYSLSLLVCFVGTFSVCEAGLGVTGFLEVFSFPFAAINRQVGGTLGFTRGYIICLIFLSIFGLHLNIGGSFFSGSFFANLFQSQAQKLDGFISSQKPENYNQLYQNQPYNAESLYKNLSKPQEPIPPRQPQQPSPQQPQSILPIQIQPQPPHP